MAKLLCPDFHWISIVVFWYEVTRSCRKVGCDCDGVLVGGRAESLVVIATTTIHSTL
jgi:hypothetical protein